VTLAGWFIMLLSVGTVSGLLAWCVYKVMTVKDETPHIHGFEQVPPDVEEPPPDEDR
jgi:hypothetical protein